MSNRDKKKDTASRAHKSPKRLIAGDHIFFDNERYEFLGYDPDNSQYLNVRDVATQYKLQLCYLDLALASPDDPPIYARSLAELNVMVERRYAPPPGLPGVTYPIDSSSEGFETLRRRARQILHQVEIVDASVARQWKRAELNGDKFSVSDAIITACSRLPSDWRLGKSTYYVQKRLCVANDCNVDKIATALHRSTHGKTRISLAVLHLLDTLIMRYYRRSGWTASGIYYEIAPALLERTRGFWVDPEKCKGRVPESLEARLLNPDIPFDEILANPEERALLTDESDQVDADGKIRPLVTLPSRSWFYQYLRWFRHLPDKGRDVITARYDVQTWERNHLVFDTFVNRAQFAREFVFADHWLIDAFTLDSEGNVVRLWLTMFIDAYSRSILGYSLLYEDPCIESILTGARSVIYPKDDLLARLGIEGKWSCYGIPMHLFLDNAWAHHSTTVQDFARDISCKGEWDRMEVDWRAPYMARWGSIIEALFGNFSQLLKALPGSLKTHDPKGIRSARESASLLYDDIHKRIVQLIVRHQNTPHRSLDNRTPEQAWLEGTRSHPISVPARTHAVERLFLRKFHGTRQWTEKGLSVFGLHYVFINGESVPTIGLDGKRIEYELRYSPLDISRMALYHDGIWLGDVYAKELRQADNVTYLPCSTIERNMAKKMAVANGNPANWYLYLSWVDPKVKSKAANARAAHKSQRGDAAQATASKRSAVMSPVRANRSIVSIDTDNETAEAERRRKRRDMVKRWA
jgi:hypothetical protein